MPDSPQDVHKKVLGRKGEKLVEEYLKKQGCKILKRNFRTPFGEADLIVEDKDEVAFVEVKTRTSDKYGLPAEAVGKTKRERYRQIAKFYWLKTGEEPNARFDVAEVFADGSIEYTKHAFM
ncbi:MAG: YraN family protein [Clostridiales bacterium]|nr:YraN family protein [Clostridiales bacterium]